MPQRLSLSVAMLALCASLTGCDKVDQCNKLINTMNTHTSKLTAITGRFDQVQTDPAVADEYEKTMQAAIDDVGALEFSDDKLTGFAGRYKELLNRAKGLGADLKAAANDAEKAQQVASTVEEVTATENTLVDEINTYCGGQT